MVIWSFRGYPFCLGHSWAVHVGNPQDPQPKVLQGGFKISFFSPRSVVWDLQPKPSSRIVLSHGTPKIAPTKTTPTYLDILSGLEWAELEGI